MEERIIELLEMMEKQGLTIEQQRETLADFVKYCRFEPLYTNKVDMETRQLLHFDMLFYFISDGQFIPF